MVNNINNLVCEKCGYSKFEKPLNEQTIMDKKLFFILDKFKTNDLTSQETINEIYSLIIEMLYEQNNCESHAAQLYNIGSEVDKNSLNLKFYSTFINGYNHCLKCIKTSLEN